MRSHSHWLTSESMLIDWRVTGYLANHQAVPSGHQIHGWKILHLVWFILWTMFFGQPRERWHRRLYLRKKSIAAYPEKADTSPLYSMRFPYPLVNSHFSMERSTIFHGKIHYFYGHFMIIPLKTPRLPGCPFDPPWLHHDAPPARTNPPAMPAGNGCLARWRSQMGWKMVKNSAKNQNTVMIICVLQKGNTRWCPLDS